MTGKPFDIYVAGPMGGYPNLNEEAFRATEKFITERLQLTALIPHDIPPYQHNGACPDGFRRSEGSAHSECCYARNDLVYMLRDCLSVVVLPKWQPSVGPRLEVTTAAQTGMPIRFLEDGQLRSLQNPNRTSYSVFPPPEGLMRLKEWKIE
jgi:hypothetical protein